MRELREFIGDTLEIDGRKIGYMIDGVEVYLSMKGLSDDEIDKFSYENYEIYLIINQIIALKHSCWIFLRATHSCQSLADDLYKLKVRLIKELKEKYNYEFDDELMEMYCGDIR